MKKRTALILACYLAVPFIRSAADELVIWDDQPAGKWSAQPFLQYATINKTPRVDNKGE